MTGRRSPWSATVTIRTGRPELARWIEEALAPEAAREVPRARTTMRRSRSTVTLSVRASDAGAMRAALNTFLGWVALSVATVTAAADAPRAPPASGGSEALISRSR